MRTKIRRSYQKITDVFFNLTGKVVILLLPPIIWMLCKHIGIGNLCKVRCSQYLDENYCPALKTSILLDYKIHFVDYEKSYIKTFTEGKVHTFHPMDFEGDYFNLYTINEKIIENKK